MPFWEVLVSLLVAFAFIALLMTMFSIIGDLIRDKNTSGLAKALWFVALIVFPWITAFVYLVVRGGGMAERRANDIANLQETQAAYIRSVAGSAPSPTDQIQQAKALLDSGAIDEAEFEALKAKALA